MCGLGDDEQSLGTYVGKQRAGAIPQKVSAELFRSECAFCSIARNGLQSRKKQVFV